MTSATIAALLAALALGFAESLRRFYPSAETWRRLRRARGRSSVRTMRRRYEEVAARKAPHLVALVLIALVVAWLFGGGLLKRRWYEIALGVLPYAFVLIALLRLPSAMAAVGARMRGYEQLSGEGPDAEDKEKESADEEQEDPPSAAAR